MVMAPHKLARRVLVREDGRLELEQRMEAEGDALGTILEEEALLMSRAAGRSSVARIWELDVKTKEGFAIGEVAVHALPLPAPRHINLRSTGPAEKQQYRVQQRAAPTAAQRRMADVMDKALERSSRSGGWRRSLARGRSSGWS
ncbi:hypothetical protein PR202_ga31660 [Eleusine coracana subsp. coracana]|uniref:Uncharacterized protein n=1 Tax=Eleusine coracana subsp. coracana TaxID=191504 RepID=A0AAV5DQI2_ELECO|nr:hypothetical protein PR202_ga31660 [Eleusine coracana subsp. coracana]